MDMIAKIHEVKINRALNELIFTNKAQIQLFLYLTKDLNFFDSYENISKEFKVSRYYFNRVKEYILEEVNSMKD